MGRVIYRSILRLHPREFRARFGAEMLWIFDEMATGRATAALLIDAVVSLLRQWIVRSGCWKAIVAVTGAFLQVTVGGFSFFLFSKGPGHVTTLKGPAMLLTPASAELLALMISTSGAIVVLVILTTLWVRRFTRSIETR